MSVALIADAHLGGPGGGAAPLVEQLRELEDRRPERLVLLGDLFQGWVGFRRYETEDVARVVTALRRLRDVGVRVDYVEGNRDFFLADGPYADAFDSVVRELPFEAGGVRYLAVHGDGLDDRDYQYRFWRWASKSVAARLLLAHTPRRLARGLVASTERRLSRTNFKHKSRIPEEVVRAFAEERLAAGHDVLLLGHFHEERRWRVAGGRVWLVDAWFRSQRVEWLPEDDRASRGGSDAGLDQGSAADRGEAAP